MNREELMDVMQRSAFDSLGGLFGKHYLEKFLDDLDNHTCKNCEYSEPHYDKELSLMCHKGVCNQILCEECGVTENFGCNEFNEKEEK